MSGPYREYTCNERNEMVTPNGQTRYLTLGPSRCAGVAMSF
jgi:hypothetical protein